MNVRPSHASLRVPWRRRLSMASRVAAASLGAYALGSVAAAALALTLPLPGEEPVIAGKLAAFLVVPAAALWTFAASTARRAWLGLLGPGVVLGLAVWLLTRGTA